MTAREKVKLKVDLLKKEIKQIVSNAPFYKNMKLQDVIMIAKLVPFPEANATCTKKCAENFKLSLCTF